MSLRAGDLEGLVKKTFEIDSYKSKIGEDDDIVVLTFTVDYENPAKDLEHFIERGYDFVLDADKSNIENDDGTYKVYVEIKRNRKIAEQILEILDGIERLTKIDQMKFRYYKSFKRFDANLENLKNIVPVDANSYKITTERSVLENFANFFADSYATNIQLLDESIVFRSSRVLPLKFKIYDSGFSQSIDKIYKSDILTEYKDVSETIYLTKIIGDYNIAKSGKLFVFENNGYKLILDGPYET